MVKKIKNRPYLNKNLFVIFSENFVEKLSCTLINIFSIQQLIFFRTINYKSYD